MLIFTSLAMATLPVPSTSQVTLAWGASPDQVAGYYLYISTQSGTFSERYNAGNSLSYDVTGLWPSTTYYFVVTAYDSEGVESDPTPEFSYTVPATPAAGTATSTYQSTSTPAGSIATLQLSSGNRSLVTIATTPGRTYKLWATSNLRGWELVGNVTATHVATQVEDAGAVTNAYRFYRAEQMP